MAIDTANCSEFDITIVSITIYKSGSDAAVRVLRTKELIRSINQ